MIVGIHTSPDLKKPFLDEGISPFTYLTYSYIKVIGESFLMRVRILVVMLIGHEDGNKSLFSMFDV